MNTSEPIIFEFETHPVEWCFPRGEAWITGWFEKVANDFPVDVRAWIDGRIFLGLVGLPSLRTDSGGLAQTRFAFRLEASCGSRHLRLEFWHAHQGWTLFFETNITVAFSTAPAEISLDWLAQLPRFARALWRDDRRSYSSWAEEVAGSAAAKPLNVLPPPPFVGALETPTDDGYVREGRLLVSGWLAHFKYPIRKLSACVSGGRAAPLAYGLQRRDVVEQFPDLLGGSHSHFVGMVELPRGLPEPILLLIFAEMGDGERCLIFARRFLPWDRGSFCRSGFMPDMIGEGVGDKPRLARESCQPLLRDRVGTRSGWRQFRLALSLVAAVRRHGVSWWDLKNLSMAARTLREAPRAARLASKGAFAESTPLSLFLSSLEDHEIQGESELVRLGPSGPDALNLLFVLHCDFSCASALHVLALGRELTQQGYDCVAAVPERLDTLDDHENPACRGILHADALTGVTFANGRGPDVVHAWSARESVRRLVERLRQIHPQLTLIVHLEDNDQRILSETLRRPLMDLLALPAIELDRLVTPDLSHPRRAPEFLASADGVTVVVDRLEALVPAGIPVRVITPAADRRYFYPRPRLEDFRSLTDRRGDATILFYHGNVHPSNAAEMRELYAAVLQLNRGGVPVRLLRTGSTPVSLLGALAGEVAPYVSDLGRIARHRHLAPLLALADIFVQPGWDDEFNAFRFPSKLPEFFSTGRPVILPRTNLGLVTRHGRDAFVLERADCASIVDAVQKLRTDRVLYEVLAQGAVTFSDKYFSWERSATALATFYASLLTEASTPPR